MKFDTKMFAGIEYDTQYPIHGLDKGIERWVNLLRAHGVYTWESCEGGAGHAFSEPTIRFNGNYAEGIKALGAALFNYMPVYELRRVWRVSQGELEGPFWDMVFRNKDDKPEDQQENQ
jgi:hypothetical protein